MSLEPSYNFPDPNSADEHGLVAIGGDYKASTLIQAYEMGIFPWPIPKRFPHAWFSPNPRAILEVNNLHLGKRLIRDLKKTEYQISFNTNFESIVRSCKKVHEDRSQTVTWITEELISGLIELFRCKRAYSVEVWNGDQLAGGLYGVINSTYITAESMFYLQPNGSKTALVALCERLLNANIPFVDVQVINDTTEKLGATEIYREDFLALINQSDLVSDRDTIFQVK